MSKRKAMRACGPMDLIEAAMRVDWGQVVAHGDSPCFHIGDDGRFCGRALRWAGHQAKKPAHLHEPLYVAITRATKYAPTDCVWTLDADEQYGHDSWDGTCGVKWCIFVGTPSENGMNYCPRCGAKLEQAKENPDAT